MKKLTLILAVALCLATAAVNAQTYVGDIDGSFGGCIPGAFSTNGHPYVVYTTMMNEYNDHDFNASIYQSDFTTHVIDINNVRDVYFIDLDNNSECPCITQNVFNSDDNFEYIEYEYEGENYYSVIAIHIKSSNGNTLWSFNAEEGFHCYCDVFKLDNKYYLLVGENRYNGYDYEYRYHLYFISQAQGLTEVKTELPISVFPSIARRNQQITVELGEGNNAKEITVVNGLGQVIKRMPVEEGQREITIPAQELNNGLNVLNTRTQQGQGSCKIIVQ